MIFPKIIYCFIKYIEIKCYIKKLNRERYKKILYIIIYILFKQLSNLCVSKYQNIKIHNKLKTSYI